MRLLLLSALTMILFSACKKIANNFTPAEGKTYFTIDGSGDPLNTGTVTNAEASAKVASDLGIKTQYVWIKNTKGLTSIDLSKATDLIELIIENNNHLTEIVLPNVTGVEQKLLIRQNGSLVNLALPKTTNVHHIDIQGNPLLKTISFNSLKRVDSDLKITYTPFQTVSFPVLESLKQLHLDHSGASSGSFDLPKLFSCDYITLGQMNLFHTFSAPELKVVGSNLLVNGNRIAVYSTGSSFQTLSLPKLKRINGGLEIRGMGSNSLASINLNGLDSIDGTLTITGLTSLQNLSFPALSTVYSSIYIHDNPQLSSISFPVAYWLGTYTAEKNRLKFDQNNLSSSQVNYLLHLFATLGSNVAGRLIFLKQNPPAPPTGQGITDKATLSALNSVYTD
jgi:hypothetical protein